MYQIQGWADGGWDTLGTYRTRAAAERQVGGVLAMRCYDRVRVVFVRG